MLIYTPFYFNKMAKSLYPVVLNLSEHPINLKITDTAYDSCKQLDTCGKYIYKTNPVFRDVSTVMEHPEFRHFVDTYFNDSHDTQAVLIFLKTYQMIEKCNPDLSPYQKLAILSKAMGSEKIRHAIHKAYLNWRDIEYTIEYNNDNDVVKK
jgi:hypothetical protein